MKLAVGYPWSVPWINTGFTETALNLKHPEGCEVRFFRGEGWCSARRHIDICEQAIEWGATHICIIGADQDHPEDMLVKLVGHVRRGFQCLTALVPMRGFNKRQGQKPFQTVGWQMKAGTKPKNGKFDYTDFEHVTRETHGDLVEINAGGTGVLLFPVSALAKIPRPWFKETGVGESYKRGQCADTPFITALQAYAGLTIYADTTIDVGHYHTFRVDRTYSERFADWEEGGGDPSICSYETAADTTTIRQVRVSPSIPFYDERFRKRYNLKPYTRKDEPAFFFGCYSQQDIEAVQNHGSTAFVIWTGTDALNMRKALEGSGKVPFGSNVKHIAISSFIEDDLRALGIPFKSLPLCCVDQEFFKPVTRRGKKGIYCFLPKNDREKYGGAFIDELAKILPPDLKLVIHEDRDSTPEQMRELYSQCFIGVRPTKHDGLSNTVVEMGLMGRRMIWNGAAPNAVQVADKIQKAAHRITHDPVDPCEHTIAQQMRDFINIGDDWKSVGFYDDAVQPYDYRAYFNMRYSAGEAGAGGPQPGGIEAELTIARVRSLIKEHDCKSVLEVGCGSCLRWDRLPDGYQGVDVSPLAIEHARKKFPHARFGVVDATKEEIPTADAVVCLDVFQHIKPEDFEPMLQRLLNAAHKVVIVKTTVDFPEQFNTFYQFKHDWDYEGWTAEPIPGVPHSRFFIFSKEAVTA